MALVSSKLVMIPGLPVPFKGDCMMIRSGEKSGDEKFSLGVRLEHKRVNVEAGKVKWMKVERRSVSWESPRPECKPNDNHTL